MVMSPAMERKVVRTWERERERLMVMENKYIYKQIVL